MQFINVTKLTAGVKFHKHRILISLFWLIGLIAGKHLAEIYSWDMLLKSGFFIYDFTCSSGLTMVIFTVLIGCIACFFGRWPLYIFLFLKSVIYSAVSAGISSAFGQAGWLVRVLLLSADAIFAIILLLFSFRSVGERFDRVLRNAVASLMAALLFLFLNSYAIAPFFTSLLNG